MSAPLCLRPFVCALMSGFESNDQFLYVNAGSNYPPIIKKQLPSVLSTQLSEVSCNREELAKAATPYNIAMKTSGYHGGLPYNDHATNTRAERRNRKRNIVWFNPPFSENVKNNIDKEFLKLVDKHFPLTTIYGKYATAMP